MGAGFDRLDKRLLRNMNIAWLAGARNQNQPIQALLFCLWLSLLFTCTCAGFLVLHLWQ